jgi:hypothetical protein
LIHCFLSLFPITALSPKIAALPPVLDLLDTVAGAAHILPDAELAYLEPLQGPSPHDTAALVVHMLPDAERVSVAAVSEHILSDALPLLDSCTPEPG